MYIDSYVGVKHPMICFGQQQNPEVHKCSYNEWNRNCRVTGDFDLVQAKGNGWTVTANKKFCSDPKGKRIDGTSLVSDASMNCLCSRKDSDLWTLIQEEKR